MLYNYIHANYNNTNSNTTTELVNNYSSDRSSDKLYIHHILLQ